MKNFNINFIVYSPLPNYSNTIGGIMVCHSLAHELAELGENSYIYANSTNPNYNCQVIPYNTDLEYDPKNTIVIYVAGADHVFSHNIPNNIKNIPNVVRWLVGDQQYNYPEDNKFYLYCDHFIPYKSQRVDGKFMSLDINFDVFQNKNKPRVGGCYYTKGHSLNKKYHKDDDESIDSINTSHWSSNSRNEYLSNMFNSKEYFICYTHRSFTAVLAALCGCTVIVIPYSWWGEEVEMDEISIKEWRASLPTFKYGIACGIEDVKWAEDTKHKVKSNLIQVIATENNNVTKFVEDCYNWMKNKYNL
jgi:hypothetical protein